MLLTSVFTGCSRDADNDPEFTDLNRNYASSTHHLTEEQIAGIQSRFDNKDMGGHAGFYETSLVMYLRPELVHTGYPHDFAGDPTGASGEDGKFIFDMLVSNNVDAYNAIKLDTVSSALINEYNILQSNPLSSHNLSHFI